MKGKLLIDWIKKEFNILKLKLKFEFGYVPSGCISDWITKVFKYIVNTNKEKETKKKGDAKK